MRINKYVALATGISRRSADKLIASNQVTINGAIATNGQDVSDNDRVCVDGTPVQLQQITTIMLNKPVGYVCSRNGQGSKTVYDLLPKQFQSLKSVGRLDKDSSGLLLLTNDGNLANRLAHPSFQKEKIYLVILDQSLKPDAINKIIKGVELEDGISRMHIKGSHQKWTVTITEGKNRQIRRTFAAIGYHVITLHRTHFAAYSLNHLKKGDYIVL